MLNTITRIIARRSHGFARTNTAIALAALTLTPSAHAQSFEGLAGSAILQRSGRTYRAGPGTKILEGDSLKTGNGLYFFNLDYSAGNIKVDPNTFVKIVELRRLKGCVRNTLFYTGRLLVNPLKFTCRDSQLLLVSRHGSHRITGTLAALDSTGDRTVLLVQSGSVLSQAAGVSVPVLAGYGNFIEKDQPPSPPIEIDQRLGVKVLVNRTLNGVKVEAIANPLNTTIIQGVEATERTLRYPIPGNSIRVEVQSADGRSRLFTFPAPYRKT